MAEVEESVEIGEESVAGHQGNPHTALGSVTERGGILGLKGARNIHGNERLYINGDK